MSLADLTLCEVNFRVSKDNAAAKVDDVEDAYPLEFGGNDDPVEDWEDGAFLEGWRFACKALANAFSWVRTKLASF